MDLYQLKTKHTGFVLLAGTKIAKKTGLDLNIARTLCLFHDIGRFPQIEKYNTLSDAKSVDHAELGIDVLNESKILDSFSEKDLIITAIKYHNKILYDIPDYLPLEIKKYVDFLRDADKVDIFRAVLDCNDYENLSSDFNPICMSHFMEGLQVNKKDVSSDADHLILILSWIYDINYPESLDLIKEQGHLETLANFLPDTLNDVKEKVYSYLGLVTPRPN